MVNPEQDVGDSEFQHTAARRRLTIRVKRHQNLKLFQHTAARRRLTVSKGFANRVSEFQHTAARRRLMADWAGNDVLRKVSTHSRSKAAD